mgnify:CR=1 FL=1|tara:strand:+ start:199 stop:939 length:741 start_codon:yes stop_codon:yes gene_type:complete
MVSKKLLIDADLYLYRSCTASEQETDWGDDVWSLWTDLKDAKQIFKKTLEDISKKLKSDDLLLCISDKLNFRKDIDPSYKSNRKKSRKPVGYLALLDWAKEEYPHFSKPKLEADDCMGIMATMPINQTKCIIVSDDKDMKTIPSELYRPLSDERLTISEQEANRFFLKQVLTGDPADGYRGLQGVGEKTAEKILGIRPDWSLVERAYLKANLSKEDAIKQAQMARILHWSDWNEKTDQPILWRPKI